MTTSEGANLEYLKNVVLTYMLSTDAANRNHMLKAIGAVLRLTKAEVTNGRTPGLQKPRLYKNISPVRCYICRKFK